MPDRLPTGAVVTGWLMVILLAGLAWLIADYPSQPTQGALADPCKPVAERQSNTERQNGKSTDAAIPVNTAESQSSDSKGNKQQQNNSDDGRLAEYTCQLAVYTAQLATFTKWLVGVTIVVAFVGIWQGYQLKTHAGHLDRSVALSETSLITVQRAFVFMRGIETTTLVDAVLVSAQWENSGSTPARRCTNYINSIWQEDNLPEDFDFPDFDAEGNPVSAPALIPFSIGPRASWSSINLRIPIGIIDQIRRKERRLFIWGWLDYDDFFPDTARHRTEFCQEFEIQAVATEPPTDAAPEGKVSVMGRFMSYPRHNGVDEECYRKPRPFTPPTRQR
jgi:hypothetical protein